MNCKSSLVAILVAAPLFAAIPSHAATPVGLGSAGDFAILAKTAISNTGTSSVVGNVGINPAGAISITGFALVLPAGSSFATSPVVTGKVLAPGYAAPSPAQLAVAVVEMDAAYADAVARPADVTGLGAGTLVAQTLAPGVYAWTTAVSITGNLTLRGGPSDVWIFKTTSTLTTAADVRIILSGGAQARNVFWQVAGATSLGARTQFKGVVLGGTGITLNTGAALEGRALAQTGVTLNASAINSGSVAQTGTDLFDGSFFIESSSDPDDVTCGVGVNGGVFSAYGDARGLGTGNELVQISFDAPQPTTTGRSRGTVSVKQNQYGTVNISFDGVSPTNGPVAVQRCAVGGSANSETLRGALSAKCAVDDMFALLTPDQIVSVQTAFANTQSVEVSVNNDPDNASIKIKCRGAATPD